MLFARSSAAFSTFAKRFRLEAPPSLPKAATCEQRARATLTGLTPLTDPGSTNARIDLLFRERAFWMYFTSHRVGDLRRLVRQYGRAPNTVWPSGNYFKGGVYGSDMNLPPAQAEKNNPQGADPTKPYTGCTDRSA